jgi:putative ABC transport system permease protein
MSVLLPLIVSVVPVLIGTRITAHQALSAYGLPTSGDSTDDAKFAWLYTWLPRPMMLSLRNTFRRKGRLSLTLITLTLAGSIFISIFSVRVALKAQFARIFDLLNYDLGVVLSEPTRTERIEREALRVEGVVGVEGWNISEAQYLRPDGSEGDNLVAYAVPPESAYIIPHIEQGRWLQSDDQNAVVVLGDFLTANPNLDIGSEIVLKIKGREEPWIIVGALPQLNDPTSDGIVYINQAYYGRLFGVSGSADHVTVKTAANTIAGDYEVLRDLEDHFKQVGIGVAHSQSVGQVLASSNSVLNIAIVMMLVMALLLAVVGGLGLAGTMSLNVIERTREIGVMRAIGASNWAVWEIVVVEGVLIGLISAVLGAILAIPMSYVLANGVGIAIMGVPLQYHYSLFGVGLWLGLSISLAALASFLPARSAVRLSVRETLAYE